MPLCWEIQRRQPLILFGDSPMKGLKMMFGQYFLGGRIKNMDCRDGNGQSLGSCFTCLVFVKWLLWTRNQRVRERAAVVKIQDGLIVSQLQCGLGLVLQKKEGVWKETVFPDLTHFFCFYALTRSSNDKLETWIKCGNRTKGDGSVPVKSQDETGKPDSRDQHRGQT